MTFFDSLFRGPQGFLIPLALGTVGIALLAVGRFRLRQTTLTAAAVWGIVALGMLTWSCIYASRLPADGPSAVMREALSTWSYLRYSAAALIIAPTLAQLGAKSPQNGAWQFIVLTLVVVLLLPVVQGWAYGNEQPEVHGLFRWLLLAHVFIGVGNYLFTRYSVAAILLAAGQLALIAEYLPFGSRPASQPRELFGLFAVSMAIMATFLIARVQRPRPPAIETLWRDFRDAFGAVWALRIAERLNASARSHGWPVEFAWGGVEVQAAAADRAANTTDAPNRSLASLDPALGHRIERELRSYLRRFVSHDWIAARLPSAADAAE